MNTEVKTLQDELARERKSNREMAMRLARMNGKNEALRTQLRLAEFKLYSTVKTGK